MNLCNCIAIIDNGVNDSFFEENKIKFNIEINEELDVYPRTSEKFVYNHATTCAHIINEYAPDSVFASIKILNNDAKGLSAQLIKAIEWCMHNHIRIVNMSIGSTSFRDFESIREIVNKACDQGIIIVAACHNKDIVSYPASLENVIGVKSDKKNILKNNSFISHLNPIDGIDITAPSDTAFLSGEEEENFYPANSYAAPRITAFVFNLLKNNQTLSLNKIKEKLHACSLNAINPTNGTQITRKTDWLTKGFLISIGSGAIAESLNLSAVSERANFKDKNGVELYLSKIENSESDTVLLLIENRNSISKEEELSLINTVTKQKRNIIYLNDTSFLSNSDIQNSSGKGWFSFYKWNFTGNEEKIINNKPVIQIIDSSESRCFWIIKELADVFKTDGYYAIGVTDLSPGVLFDFEFLPCFDTVNEKTEFIKSVIHCYNVDLLIFVTNSLHSEFLKDDLEPDIILKLKETNKSYEFTPVKKDYNERSFNTINELYNYILDIIQ